MLRPVTQRSRPRSPDVNATEDPTDLIGETPLLDLSAFAPGLYGKVEAWNPYSVKDRIAREMIAHGEEADALTPATTVVEATSGNTGIGLAFVCAARGYDCVLTMPASMSEERRRLLRALGADVVLTPAENGMAGAIEHADALAQRCDDVFRPRQFETAANPAAHRRTTGPEIWRATDGAVDAVVAGVGTGGTVTGVGHHFERDRGADVRVVAVEPAESPLLSAGESGDHDIQGIGPDFVPGTLDRAVLNDVRTVASEVAKETARELASETGLVAGVSAGAALRAGVKEATDGPAETTVAVLPDTGERYLSTDLYATAAGDLRTADDVGEATDDASGGETSTV